MALEDSKFIMEPVVPPCVFGNRTSVAIFVATFLNSALIYWIIVFLPCLLSGRIFRPYLGLVQLTLVFSCFNCAYCTSSR